MSSRNERRYVRPSVARTPARTQIESLEPRRMLSATIDQIAAALDLPDGVVVTYTGHGDAAGVYENYSVDGLLGMPSGPDGDFLVLSTGRAHDAVRITDNNSRGRTTRGRDLGAAGAADDFATVSFTLTVPAAVYSQRLLMDFLYASDMGTDGGDFFDVFVNGINIAETGGARIEAGGQYVINERDPDIDDDIPGYGIEIDTEYSDLLRFSYTIPGGVTTLDIVITIQDSNDAEFDAWAILDNVRFTGTQVVYLDFDGEDIGGFVLETANYVVDAFDFNDFGLGSDFADVIRADLETIFADFDIVFVTELPTEGEFMHVIVGGSNDDEVSIADTNENEWLVDEIGATPTFTELFNWVYFRNANGTQASYGMADRLDLGNANQSDTAVVFAEQLSRDGFSYARLRDTIAHYIGRNLGLRAESSSFVDSIMAEDITFRGGEFQDEDHVYVGDDWGDVDAFGPDQNAHQVLLDVLGAGGGETEVRSSWADVRRLNQAHWTIVPPTSGSLHDAQFIIVGDKHTRTTRTTAPEWSEETILVSDFAGQDPRIVITAASRSGQRHDYETGGSRNLGQFTAVTRDARVVLISLFNFTSQGPVFRGSASLTQTNAADTVVYFSEFEFTEDDGDDVTIRLSSNTGLFTVSETDLGVFITLAETDSERDSLTVTVQKRPGGDGIVVLGGIQGSGLKTITANKADFSGSGINLERVEKNGKFGSIRDGTDVNIRQEEGDHTILFFDRVTGDSTLVFGRETQKISFDNVTGAAMVFDELTKLDSKEDLSLTRLDVAEGKDAKIIVKGNIAGGAWTIETDDDKDTLASLDVKGGVSGGFSLDVERRLERLKVKENFDGAVTAMAMRTLKIDGEWSGSLVLSDDGTEYRPRAAESIKVKGAARGVLFKAKNDVDNVKLGAAIDVNFYVGFEDSVVSGLPVDPGLLENDEARVKTFMLKGVSGEPFDMVNSFISAAEFGTLKLGDIDADNAGVPFGVSAISIDLIEFDTGTGRVSQRRDEAFLDNDNGDDFFLGQIV